MRKPGDGSMRPPPQRRRLALMSAAVAALAAGAAAACEPRLGLRLAEGSPRDSLRLETESVADWRLVRLEIDLSASAGGLIFDSAAGGGGVAGYGDLEAESGAVFAARPALADGGQTATLLFEPVAPGAVAWLSLDVDGAGGYSATILSDEIRRAEARALFRNASGGEIETYGVFDDGGEALLIPAACS